MAARSETTILFITDSSFKRRVLVDWGIIDIFRHLYGDVRQYPIHSLDPQSILSTHAGPKPTVVAYCVNERCGLLDALIDRFRSNANIRQIALRFDCYMENLAAIHAVDSVSVVDLVVEEQTPSAHSSIARDQVVLINPEGWQKESTNLGLAYIAGALRMIGFEPTIFDVNRYPMSYDALGGVIADIRPMLIGYSAKTAVAEESARLCEYLKGTSPETKMVLGGPHATLCAEEFLNAHTMFDAACLSESELSFPKMALWYAAGLPVEEIENVAYRKNGTIMVNPFSPPQDINFPFWPDFDAIERFAWDGYRYPVVTSRGCPYGCIYCCVNKLTGDRKWRYRDPENVIAELEYVKNKYGINLFEIWDDNFTLDIERAKTICRMLIEQNLNLSWWCHNGIRADRIDDELASLMKQAGCTSIALGIESGTAEVFDSIDKGESIGDILRGIHIIKRAGIQVVGYFIIGLPADTLEKFIKTVELQRSLQLDHYTFGILIPYPKTKVWDIIHEHGRMLMDVTGTQHFASDIVPISFSLPSFPPQDITRAFYIAKYFELFDTVRRHKGPVRVCIQLNDDDQPNLFGLILSLPCRSDVSVLYCGVFRGFTPEQQQFLDEHSILSLSFSCASIQKNKKPGNLCLVSKNLVGRGELFFEKYIMFCSDDSLRPLKIRWKIVELIKTCWYEAGKRAKQKIRKVRGIRHVSLRTLLRQKIQIAGHKLRVLNFVIGAKITHFLYKRLKRKLGKGTSEK